MTITAASTPSEAGGSSSSSHVVPAESRLEYTIGNLGWDDDESVIEARAREILTLCKIDSADFEGPVAVRKKGSLAEMRVSTPNVGCLARLRCKALRKCFHGNKICWIDVKKTQAELQPGRIVRRCCEFMQHFENLKDNKQTLTSNLRDMTVSSQGIMLCNLRIRPILFSATAIARYTDVERGNIMDIASN